MLQRKRFRRKLKKHRFLCVETSDGYKVYPEFQFNNKGSLPTTLPKILNVLLPVSDSWTILYWLTDALEDFGWRTAVEVLADGNEKECKNILAMAKKDAAVWQDFQPAEESATLPKKDKLERKAPTTSGQV